MPQAKKVTKVSKVREVRKVAKGSITSSSKPSNIIASPSMKLRVNSTKQSQGKSRSRSSQQVRTIRRNIIASKTNTKTAKKSSESKVQTSTLSAEVFDTTGKKQGTFSLPKEIFGQKVNKALLSQALHVYFENQSKHAGSTKTRAETRGGGAKPWRQKGTGRARAGSRRSPLWVGGGVTHGPKYRNVQLALPKKMKRAALTSALSQKASTNSIKIISSIEKIQPKTKIIANFLKKLDCRGSSLFIVTKDFKNKKNFLLATRNIQKTNVDVVNNLNAFNVIKFQNLFFTKESINTLS